MPELKNVRHERFAQNIAKGMSGGPGYTAAGYKATGHSADVSASRLLRNVDIRTRVAELTAPALAETGATVERVLKELTCLAFYNVTQILESDDDGLTMKDPRTLPKDLRRSIIGIKPIHVGEEAGYEYTFVDKLIPSLAEIASSHRAPKSARKARPAGFGARPSVGQIGAPGALRRLPDTRVSRFTPRLPPIGLGEADLPPSN